MKEAILIFITGFFLIGCIGGSEPLINENNTINASCGINKTNGNTIPCPQGYGCYVANESKGPVCIEEPLNLSAICPEGTQAYIQESFPAKIVCN